MVSQQNQRRRDIIDEFFRAYHAARHKGVYGSSTSCTFAEAVSSHSRRIPKAVPACLAVLGLPWPCTEQQIKRAFRMQAKQVHPDVGGSSEAFRALWQAYQEALTLIKG